MRVLIFVVSAAIICEGIEGEPDKATNVSGGQISEKQAIHQLTTWIKSHHYYDVSPDCLMAKSLGYKNVGYTIELIGTAGCPPQSMLEGTIVASWRVDAKTAEIYVQNRAGKYVSPQPVTYWGNPAAGTGMRVPFVGCKADGMSGPVEAPKSAKISGSGRTYEVRLDPNLAKRLAFYDGGLAVLGPRGWFCFETYGSGGSTLYVTPEPFNPDDIFNSKWKGITGFGIEAHFSSGETSGRRYVADVAARIFPKQRPFVESVIAMYPESASDFHFSPFPADRLTYLNERVVEYQTAPHSEGLGTRSGLRPNSDSIRGVAIWLEKRDGPDRVVSIVHLAIRLPQNMKDLVPTIIKEFETRENSDW